MNERGWDLIVAYSRAQALEDGVLVDLTEWASEREMMGGFRVPVAVTASVWADINAIPPRLEGIADVRGRAHDVLWMAYCAAAGAGGRDRVEFEVLLDTGKRKRQVYQLVIGPGDHGEPVATIMQPGED